MEEEEEAKEEGVNEPQRLITSYTRISRSPFTPGRVSSYISPFSRVWLSVAAEVKCVFFSDTRNAPLVIPLLLYTNPTRISPSPTLEIASPELGSTLCTL